MQPAALPDSVRAALETFERAGGVVEHFVFEVGAEPDPHTAATLQAFASLRAKLEPFVLTLEPTRIASQPITRAAFLGEMRTGMGVLHSPGAFLHAQAESMRRFQSFSCTPGGGYLMAFSDPPYGLQLGADDAQALFETIRDYFFPETADLEIRSFTTDWSNYFRAGLEWWGAYWWTVLNRARGIITVIAASSTD
jgi:hypothetical protein